MSKQIYEVESKHELTCSASQFAAVLIQKGFTVGKISQEIDTYYSRPDVDYMKTVECLRIRRSDGYSELTYKPPTITGSSHVIVKPETNVELKDADSADSLDQLFSNLDMITLAVVDKKRITYKKNHDSINVTVSIDTIKDIGSFVEIEILSDTKQLAHDLVLKIESELGVDKMPIIEKPYRDIVMEYNNAK